MKLQRVFATAPVCLALFPILSLWSGNQHEATAAELGLPLSAAALTGLTLLGVGRLIFGGFDGRAALWASCAVACLWAWSPLARLVADEVGGPIVAGSLVGILALPGLFLLARWLRRKPHLDAVATGLGVAGLVAVAIPGAQLVRAALQDAALEREAGVAGSGAATAPGPDIYWIVLDAFGREDVLREHYGIEDGLAEALREQGFFVADRSASNYTTTLHVIPSVLNMDYIQNLVSEAGRGGGNARESVVELSRSNRLVRRLRARGYEWIVYSSGVRITELGEFADVSIQAPDSRTELEALLLERSPVGWLASPLPVRSAYQAHRARVLHALRTLPGIADDPRATFTFLHVLSPHHPFVFGPRGEDVSIEGQPFRFNDGGVAGRKARPGQVHADYVRSYGAQALFIGRQVAEAVAEIRERSPEPPVIIVQGDHGPNSHWPNIVPWERLPILNALLVPGVSHGQLDPAISPVNNFRFVLRELLGEDVPPLPDRHYLSTYAAPLVFEEVPAPSLPGSGP